MFAPTSPPATAIRLTRGPGMIIPARLNGSAFAIATGAGCSASRRIACNNSSASGRANCSPVNLEINRPPRISPACQLARFHLMRQITHLFYTTAFLFQVSPGRQIDWSEPVPEFRDYQQRMWAGVVDLVDNDRKILYDRDHWERLVKNVQQARYKEVLKIVLNWHPANPLRRFPDAP